MLVFVPQEFVALVYEGGKLCAVLEAGVGFVPGAKAEVQYVYLEPPAQPADEAQAAMTLQ